MEQDIVRADLVDLWDTLEPETTDTSARQYLRLAPRHPGAEVPPCRVPGPPPIPEDPDLWPERLIQAHRAAVLTGYRAAGAGPAFRQKLIRTVPKPGPNFRLLQQAGALLHQHQVSPMLWCGHRVRTYLSREQEGGQESISDPPKGEGAGRSKKRSRGRRRRSSKTSLLDSPPPLKYVFNLEAIENQRGWCTSRVDEICPTYAFWPARLWVLLKRWEEMRDYLTTSGVTSEEEAAELIENLLPSDNWEREMDSLREEVRIVNEQMTAQLADGRWIWEW